MKAKMIENQDFQKRYYNRVKERQIWLKLGQLLFILGFSLLAITVIMAFLDSIPFKLETILLNVGVLGALVGSVISTFFGRLGWSASKLIDFVLNRFSIVLIFMGMTSGILDIILPRNLGFGTFVFGIILVLLGIRYQTPVKE